jgi:hypothetical protein
MPGRCRKMLRTLLARLALGTSHLAQRKPYWASSRRAQVLFALFLGGSLAGVSICGMSRTT